jgi:biotin operon repressor
MEQTENTNQISPDQQAELLDFFLALSNPERLKVVGVIAIEPMSMAQIAERLKWAPTEVYKHISSLEHFGLVKNQDGAYRLDTDALHQKSRRILSGSRPRMNKDDFEGEAYERKVLSDFFAPGEKLKQIPLQRKKFVVVLRYLLRAFEPGQRYSEKQVNELLKRYHLDAASLRRGMVDEGMLARQDGVYWLVGD